MNEVEDFMSNFLSNGVNENTQTPPAQAASAPQSGAENAPAETQTPDPRDEKIATFERQMADMQRQLDEAKKPRPAAQPQAQPQQMTEEQRRQQFNDGFFVDPYTNLRATFADMLKAETEPLRAQASESSVRAFVSERQQQDPLFSITAPAFQEMLADEGTRQAINKMPPHERDFALGAMWDTALGRSYRAKFQGAVKDGKYKVTPAPSYGAGYSPVTAPSAGGSAVDNFDEPTRMAYDRLIQGGMPEAEALSYLTAGDE